MLKAIKIQLTKLQTQIYNFFLLPKFAPTKVGLKSVLNLFQNFNFFKGMPDMSSYWNPASMIAPGCPTPECPTPVESVHSSPSSSPRSPMAGSPSSDDKHFSSVPMIYQHILQSPADQTTTCDNSELPKICQVQSLASPICKTPTKTKLKGKKECFRVVLKFY